MSAGAIKAGEAYVELSARDQALRDALEANRERLQGFTGQVQQMATQFALKEIKEALTIFPQLGDSLNKMSARTGFSAQALSELDFAAARSGASITDVEMSIKGMNMFTLEAERALRKAALAGDDMATALRKVSGDNAIRTFTDMGVNAEAFFATIACAAG